LEILAVFTNMRARVVVGAFSFSTVSIDKIEKAGGEAVSLSSLLKKYPEGKGVLLLGG
jgi:ribosomal protein L18E